MSVIEWEEQMDGRNVDAGPYRKPGERDERPDAVPLHVGARETCPACKSLLFRMTGPHGNEKVWIEDACVPRFCGPVARVKVGWLRRCKVGGEHLHQRCHVCAEPWLCATVEAIGDVPE